MKKLAIVALLSACGDNARVCVPDLQAPFVVDATHAAPPPIAWDEWGGYCEGGIYGYTGCRSDTGKLGTCIRDRAQPVGDGLYAGECRPACNPQPPFAARCPADGVAIPDDMGCTCAETCN